MKKNIVTKEDFETIFGGCDIKDTFLEKWFDEYLKNKKDISLENVFLSMEDLFEENKKLKKEIKEIRQDIEDNYRPISKYEQFGISENNFI